MGDDGGPWRLAWSMMLDGLHVRVAEQQFVGDHAAGCGQDGLARQVELVASSDAI